MGGIRKESLFIKHMQHSIQRFNATMIPSKCDMLPCEALTLVHRLLVHGHSVDECTLKALVGIVDKKLLE